MQGFGCPCTRGPRSPGVFSTTTQKALLRICLERAEDMPGSASRARPGKSVSAYLSRAVKGDGLLPNPPCSRQLIWLSTA